MTRRLLLLLVPAALLGAAGAALPPRYALDGASRFRIDGTSTVGRWSCAADDGMAGGGEQAAHDVSARLTVRVAAFDCGVSRMTRDFRDALRAGAHPEIAFVLERAAATAPEARPGAWVPVLAEGRLRLAGTERPVRVRAEGRREASGRVRVRGSHAMRMTDFGVRPPTGLGGAVRARDAITVVFDLVAVETR